jgi:hypothetical protein
MVKAMLPYKMGRSACEMGISHSAGSVTMEGIGFKYVIVFNPSLTITYKDLSQISQAWENLRGYRPSQVAPDLRWRGGRVEFRKCVRPQI